MPVCFEMGEDLRQVVAHHRAEHHVGQASFAQVDEVAQADAEQVGEFLFSQPPDGECRCMGVHAPEHRVNHARAGASLLRNEVGRWAFLWLCPFCFINTSIRLPINRQGSGVYALEGQGKPAPLDT